MKLKIGNLKTDYINRIEEIGDSEASRISGGRKVPIIEKSSGSESSWLLSVANGLAEAQNKFLESAIDALDTMQNTKQG